MANRSLDDFKFRLGPGVRVPWQAAVCILALMLFGCQEGIDVDTEFAPTSYRLLRGVSLGMTAEELRATRTAAVFSPYRGYRENVQGMDVAYDFSPGAAAENSIDDEARLERIIFSRSAASERDAKMQWRAVVDSIVTAYGAPARCERIRGTTPGDRAIWRTRGAVLDVSVRAPLNTGTEIVPDRVLLTLTRKESKSPLLDASAIPCSTIDQ